MSIARITHGCIVTLILIPLSADAAGFFFSPQASSAEQNSSPHAAISASQNPDPARIFQHGQDALSRGELDVAERDFRRVLALDAKAGAAYANLGVVYMRRKQWGLALTHLKRASSLMPNVPGVRLNIGLAYYRQNDFEQAIPAFESVVKDQPDALQPRYLLGLCYFFAERWADAASTLEPLWPQASNQFPYLYVLSNAAHRAGNQGLDDRASTQLIKIGDGSAEYHLFTGKYYLNLNQFDSALAEFQAAAQANPTLPFVHFNLGLTYARKQQYNDARDEFLKDAAIEPDLALNYDQLGEIARQQQDTVNARKYYRDAMQRDPRLVNPHLGFAKIAQSQQDYPASLAEFDAALKLDPAHGDVHYSRAQILLRMGRKTEAQKELAIAEKLNNAPTKKPASQPVPSPELLQDSQ